MRQSEVADAILGAQMERFIGKRESIIILAHDFLNLLEHEVPSVIRTFPRASVAALMGALALAGCSDDDPIGPTDPDEVSAADARRLVVADAENPILRVVGLGPDASDVTTLNLTAPASYLYASGSGRFAVAQQRAENVLHIIDGGVEVNADEIAWQTPSVVAGFNDAEPTHGNVNGDIISVFFDGNGMTHFWDEDDLLAGETDPFLSLGTGGAYHGATVAKGDGEHVVVTWRDTTSILPSGVNIFTREGVLVDSTRACPALHGNAGNRDWVVIGCGDGLLTVRMDGSTPEFDRLNLADGPQWGTGTVWSAWDADRFLLRNTDRSLPRGTPPTPDNRRLATFAPATGTIVNLTLPDGDVDWTADLTKDGRYALVLGRTGNLYVFSMASAALVVRFDAIVGDPDSMPTDAAPFLTSAYDRAYLSDPAGSEVIELDLASSTPAILRRISVAGVPTRLAVVGPVDDGEYVVQN